MDCDALVVCNVDNTRCPCPAALMAAEKTDVIPHFADHDDVRVLAQNVPERMMERNRVQADLPLFNHRLIVFKNVFNRVFQRNDMLFEITVNVFNHGRERGGFAATGGSGHQHDSAGGFGNFFYLLQQPEFFKAGHLRLDVAHRQTPLAALLKQIGAETPDCPGQNTKNQFPVPRPGALSCALA